MVSLAIQIAVTLCAVPLAIGIYLHPKSTLDARCWAMNTVAGLFGYWFSFINASRRK